MIWHEHRNFCILYLSELKKPLSNTNIRDIADLKVGDIKELCWAWSLRSPPFLSTILVTRKNKFTIILGIKKEPNGSDVKNIK